MDFLQQLLSKAAKAGGGRSITGGARQPPTAPPSVVAADATPWKGSGKGADESVPPSVQYDFSNDAAGQRLRERWAAFEGVYADMGKSLEDKLAAFRPFCRAFVEAHQDRGPDMWRVDDPEEEDEGEDDSQAEPDAPAPPVTPSSTETARGRSKVVVVIVSTLFMDAWARGGGDQGDQEAGPSLAPGDCTAQERAWLHKDTHDLLACYRTLAALTTPLAAAISSAPHRRRRRRDLVCVLEAMVQLAKARHDRRLLLHSLGDGLAHFLASLLLALGRRLEELWAQQEGEEQDEEATEALAFLLTCLLLAAQVFGHSVPALPHYCRLLELRAFRGGPIPPHPWSGPRVAGMCESTGVAAQHGDDGEEDNGGMLERSMRGLAVRESWSLLALQQGVLPAILRALRLSLQVSAGVAERGGRVYEARRGRCSSSGAEEDDSSHPLLDAGRLDLWRLLLVFQAEALLGVGTALAAHPHEALAAMEDAGGDTPRLLTENLTAALALGDAAGMDLRLAWARAECALALLQECVPVVQATHHVQGRLLASSVAQPSREGGKGFPWSSSSSGAGGGRASMEAPMLSPSLTVQDLGSVLLEGLGRGVPRIEPLLGQAPVGTSARPSFQLEAPATIQPPLEQPHYDLYPWRPSSTNNSSTAEELPPPPAGIERQGSRVTRLSLKRSLSASSVLLSLEDVIDAARPLLLDARATYRLLLEAPVLLAPSEGAKEEGAERMYASIFAHLLALCGTPGEQATQQQQAEAQPVAPHQQQREQPPSMLSVALRIVQGLLQPQQPARASPALPRHVTAFLARCLLLAPLETIAGCRHLGLWPLLLGAVGLPATAPLDTTATAAQQQQGDEKEGACVVRVQTPGADATAWLHAQDLCLELLHWTFLAAQRPPTTNFLSAPTLEMGLVAGLLEAAVAGINGMGKEAQPVPLLLAFRACRWLDLLIREQDDASASATGASASIPAFNEHGHRLLALLPHLLARLNNNSSSAPASPLLWPVRHAALSLLASLVHVASLVESQLALTAWAADALFGLSPPGDDETAAAATATAAATTAVRRPLDPVFDEVARAESRPVALFILTRALHITAQLALSAAGAALDAAALGLYREYLQRWRAHACRSADAGGKGEAAVDMARALCALLREQEAYSAPVVRFHQWALRRAGAFAVAGEALQAGAAAARPALVNQCLALLTALAGDNAVNRGVLAAAFLQQDESEPPQLLCLILPLLAPAALPDGFDTVRALLDLAVGGAFPIGLLEGEQGEAGGGKGSVVIRSLGVVTLLFQLLPHLPAELQVSVFRMLRALVARGADPNGHRQHDHGAAGPSPSELNSEVHGLLLPLLLDAIQALPPCSAPQGAAIDLLAEVGAVHMTVPHLRRLLRLLQPHEPNDDESGTAKRPANMSRLLHCLDRMVGEERFAGPSHYFWMDGGAHSGVRLRPLAGFSRRHYSFVTWVYLEDGGDAYRPYLFSLVAEDGTTLDAYLLPNGNGGGGGRCYALQLEYRRNKASPMFVEWSEAGGAGSGDHDAPTVVAGRWTFLAISHRAPAGFRAAADVTVLADDACFKGALPYPSLKSLSARSHVGGRHDPGPAGGGLVWGTGLRGRMGAVYLLDEYMKEEQLRALRARGPDYTGGSNGASGQGLLDPAWEGSLLSHNRVMLFLHPARLRPAFCDGAQQDAAVGVFRQEVEEGAGRLLLNGAATEGAAWDWRGRPVLEMVRAPGLSQPPSLQLAVSGHGTVAVARTRIVDALECVGGAKVLLPLFAQLGLPSDQAVVSTGEEEDDGDAVRLFDLLGKCLAQSPPGYSTRALFNGSGAASDEEAEADGASAGEDEEEGALLLAHLLERLPRSHLTPGLLAAIQRLLSRALLLSISNTAAATPLVLHLLGGDGGAGLRAWRHGATWETQQEALALLLLYLQPASSRAALPLARRIDPARLLDALRRLYPYSPEAEQDTTQQLAATRRALLDVVATTIAVRAADASVSGAQREGDMAALFDALAAQALDPEKGDDRGRGACELLQLLLRLLPTTPDLAAYILSSPGSPAYLLLHLTGAHDQQPPLAVRLLAFRALVAACVLAPRQWQEERRRRPSSSGKRSGMALLRSSLSSVGVKGFGEAADEEKDGFLVVRPEMTCVEGAASEEAQEEQLREVLYWATWRLLQGEKEEEGQQQRRAVAAVASRVLADAMAGTPGVAQPRQPILPALRAAGALPAWWFEDEDEEEKEEEGQAVEGDAGVEAAMAALSVTDPDVTGGVAFPAAVPAFVYATSGDGEAAATYGLEELEARVASALEGNAEHAAAWLALLERRRVGGEERSRAAEAAAQEERVWVWHHRWQRLLDAVAEERGVWGPGRARLRRFGGEGTGLAASVGPAGVSWVVDDVEDRLRHRRKLVRRRRPGFVLPGAIGDEAARLQHADASARMRGGSVPAVAVEGGEGGPRLAPAIERLVEEGQGRVERSNSREELWRDLVKYQRAAGEEEDEDDEEMEEGIDEEAMAAAAAGTDTQDRAGRETPVSIAGAAGAGAASPPPKALQASPTKQLPVATPTRPVSLALGEKRRPGSASLGVPAGVLGLRAGGKSSVPLAASVSPRALALPGGGGGGSSNMAGMMMGTGGLTLARLLSTAAGGGVIPLAAGVKEARPCEVIRPFVVSPGLFEVHKAALRFTLQEGATAPVPPEDSTAWCLQPFPSTLWRLDELRAMYLRLYQQQPTALELFFADNTSLLLNFHARPAAVAVYKAIRKLGPRGLEPHLGSRPTKVWQRMRTARGSALTQAWQRREISNFEYLSYLNLVAGRTYHDLSQYPIFPWVLADYTSETLDLNARATYRDLRWPMGAQRPEARPLLQETYRTLEEDYLQQRGGRGGGGGGGDDEHGAPPLPPFHHGSHYSTAAFVLWYLLRLEPYASLHVHLQGGRFDHPDRQLRSLAAAYDGCTRNPSDVKELVPEAFFVPDFLTNGNGFALGATQRGEALGDVALPPWAKGSPEEFVRLHRAALESEYVSAHLHHWIDLVFGFRQRPPHLTAGGKGGKGGGKGGGGEGGQAAVEACNVFFHLTYHGALDMEALRRNDPLLYESTLKQIQDFGQTPLQLLTAPHPPRTPLHKATDLVWPLASAVPGAGTAYLGDESQTGPVSKPERLLSFPPIPLSAAGPLLVVAEATAGDRVVTVDGAWRVGAHGWSALNPDAVPPFKLRPDLGGGDGGLLGGVVPGQGEAQEELALDVDAQLLFTCGYLDGSFKVTALDYEGPGSDGPGGGIGAGGGGGKAAGEGAGGGGGGGGGDVRHRLLQSVAQHRGVVRCLALGRAKGALHHHGPHRHNVGAGASAITAAAAAGLQGASVNLGSGVGVGIGAGGGIGGCAAGRAYLATGGDDCTVRVWVVACRAPLPAAAFDAAGEGWHPGPGSLPVHPRPLHVLAGHDAPVLCLAVDAELDLVVSGGADGRVLVHSLREGRYIRTLELGEKGAIHWVGISHAGYLLSYSRDWGLLRSHGLSSGRPCARLQAVEGAAALHAFCLSEDGQVLLVGGEDRRVTLRWCHSLGVADDGPRAGMGAMAVVDGSCESMVPRIPPFGSAVRSLALTAGERHLLVGLESGEMYVLAPDAAYLRSRLKKRLETLGFF